MGMSRVKVQLKGSERFVERSQDMFVGLTEYGGINR